MRCLHGWDLVCCDECMEMFGNELIEKRMEEKEGKNG